MKDDSKVILFSKFPQPGYCKTRLIPSLGENGAAQCQRVMTEHVLRTLIDLPVELWYSGGSREQFAYWLDRLSDVGLVEQEGDGLGERIALAFQKSFSEGMKRVVVIGSDIPGLKREPVESALDTLCADTPMVLIPASDGGYVLVGLYVDVERSVRELFMSGIEWGSDRVLSGQLRVASELGLKCKVLDLVLSDVDMPEDLVVFEEETGFSVMSLGHPIITIVVPVLNEENVIVMSINNWIDSAMFPENIRIVIVDGGSIDATVSKIESINDKKIKVIHSDCGRGKQIHSGIEYCKVNSDIILMVHADVLLPEKYDETLLNILRTPGVSAGSFRFALDSKGVLPKLVETLTNARSIYRELPYGDQAIFVFKKTLSYVGGIRRDYPFLEDLDLITRLRQVGRIVIANTAVTISARRWEKHGYIKVTLVNQMILMAHRFGINPSVIGKWYYSGAPFWWAVPLFILILVFFTIKKLI